MKSISFLIMASLLTFNAFSQEEGRAERRAAREAEKAQRQKETRVQEEAKARLVDSLITKRNFLLTAEFLGDNTGNRIVVDSKVNFIVIDSSNIVIQTGSMTSFGYNGLGGLTTDGNITRFNVARTGKNKQSYMISLMTMTPVGMFDIFINISPDGNATATISGNTRGKVIYYGDIAPVKGTRIFKGMSI